MDLTKDNPILGYQMYTTKDKSDMAARSAYGTPMPVRRTPKTERDV